MDQSQTQTIAIEDYPDLWGLTANEVANRNTSASNSLQEYHLDLDDNVQSEVRSIKEVANYPLHLLVNNLKPFNYSLKKDGSNPPAFLPIFQNSIRLYQLYVFYVFAISELGSPYGKEILDIQSVQLDKLLGEQQGSILSARFDDITLAAKQHAEYHHSNYDYLALDIPVENSIAKIFLLNNKESPLHADFSHSNNTDGFNFRGIDLALAEHLGQAKDIALQIYAHYFNVVIVEI